MGRPRGHRLSQETKNRIAASQRARHAASMAPRLAWQEASEGILAAANAGDRDLATELLWDYMSDSGADLWDSLDPGYILNYSAAERQADIAEAARELDDLFAETVRLQDERKRQQGWTDEDTEQFRRTLQSDIRALLALSRAIRREEQRMYPPSKGIPSPTERAAAARRNANRMPGDPLETLAHISDAASVPYVSERQTRHEPMTGTHTHDHAAYDASDHDDGVHSHQHSHDGDAMHDHPHRGGR